MNPKRKFDVIVLGGGPAGSTTAAYLARMGRRVLVLEKERFPRFHIGESLLPYNRRIFEELGLVAKLDNADFMIKEGAQFWLANGKKHTRVLFSEGCFNQETTAYQVERSVFDEMLLRHCEKLGASVREGCAVTGFAVKDSHVSVEFADGRTEEAEFLIDATGMANFTANREGIRRIHPRHKKVAIFGHFADVAMPGDDSGRGDIIIVRLEHGWFWLIPLTMEKTSIGLVMDKDAFRSAGHTPEEAFRQCVASSPVLQEKMDGSSMIGKLHVISDFSYTNDRLTSPRLLRVGDAAGFMDPIFSSGVYLAMMSGREAAHCVSDALARGKTHSRSMVAYEKRLRRQMKHFWDLIENYYTPEFIDLFMEPKPPLRLRAAVNSILAGRLDTPLSVTWRLKLFFAMVKLQKKFALVPRTEFN